MKQAKATAKVHEFLVSEKRYDQDHKINPGRVAVIDRLLAYGDTLDRAWAEILEKATPINPHGSTRKSWQFVVDRLLYVGQYRSLDKTCELREQIRTVDALNKDIAKLATELARKMRYRNSLQGPFDITLPADNDPIMLMSRAAELGALNDPHLKSHLGYNFKAWIKPELEKLWYRFDWKYWPDMADMVEALAEAQGNDEYGYADPAPTNAIGAASVDSPQHSPRDFYRALDSALDDLDNHSSTGCRSWDLTPDTFADLCNALLGLDAVITPKAVKTYRNQERKRVAQQSRTTLP